MDPPGYIASRRGFLAESSPSPARCTGPGDWRWDTSRAPASGWYFARRHGACQRPKASAHTGSIAWQIRVGTGTYSLLLQQRALPLLVMPPGYSELLDDSD